MRTPWKLLTFCLLLLPSSTRAGGFDIPDVGVEALARGGAFAARADSPLALYYNVAGLAGQHGTTALVDVNFTLADMAFTRQGSYSGDPNDPNTPWAGKPYPTVHNSENFGYQPFIAVVSDLGGRLPGLTLGLGVYAPPGIGKRRYGDRREFAVLGKDNVEHTVVRYEVDFPTRDTGAWQSPPTARAPSPARYDLSAADLTILMPTIAAGYRINQLFDVGLGFQLVVGEFQLINAAATPAQATTCGAAGDAPNCDSYGQVVTHSLSPAFLLSGMAHPKKWLDVGLTLRPQVDINSSGFITPAATSTDGVSSVQLDRFPATFSIKLPTIVRAGARIVARDPDGFERGDIELDATWENWSVEQEAIVHSEMHPLAGTFDVRVPHHYKDVVSFRLGGAYNHPLADRKHVTLRAGAYYESPTTDVRDTHLDAFTTDKVGLTAGVGLRLGAVTFNIAYAGVFMPSRNVTDGTLRAASSTNGTTWAPTDPDISHVNNGRYESTLHIVAAGMTIHFNEAH